MTFTYLLKVTDSNRDHLSRLNVIFLQTVTVRAKITIANINILPLRMLKVKVMQISTVNIT